MGATHQAGGANYYAIKQLNAALSEAPKSPKFPGKLSYKFSRKWKQKIGGLIQDAQFLLEA
jgi:hypothetical protein